MKSKVNLHIHTENSDGVKSVSETVPKLKDAGIEYFAITDHDNVDDNFEATVKYAKKYKMKYFSGIELSCQFSHRGINSDDFYKCHILGLGIKVGEMWKKLEELRKIKSIKVRKLHELLVNDGHKLKSITNNPTFKSIINELISNGYATDKNACKKKILSNDKYQQYATFNFNMDVQTAIQTIKECGGFAIWAHPFRALGSGKEDLNEEQIKELLDLLCGYGLDGIEVYYQFFSAEKIRFLESLADSKKLIKSIGTDYHRSRDDTKNVTSFDVEGIIPDETIIVHLENRMENENALL